MQERQGRLDHAIRKRATEEIAHIDIDNLRKTYATERDLYLGIRDLAHADFVRMFDELRVNRMLNDLAEKYNKYSRGIGCIAEVLPLDYKAKPPDTDKAFPNGTHTPPGLPYIQALYGYIFRISPNNRTLSSRHSYTLPGTCQGSIPPASDFLVMGWQPYLPDTTSSPKFYAGIDASELTPDPRVVRLRMSLGDEPVQGCFDGWTAGDVNIRGLSRFNNPLIKGPSRSFARRTTVNDVTGPHAIDRLFGPPQQRRKRLIGPHYFAKSASIDPSYEAVNPMFLADLPDRVEQFVNASPLLR